MLLEPACHPHHLLSGGLGHLLAPLIGGERCPGGPGHYLGYFASRESGREGGREGALFYHHLEGGAGRI